MIQALLDGRKTQTRRVIKPQPNETSAQGKRILEVVDYFTGVPSLGKAYYWKECGCWNSSEAFQCPYGKVGDLLWVKEPYGFHQACPYEEPKDTDIVYKADGFPSKLQYEQEWKPSIFMPKWASRLTLKITDIRAERVQDISEKDSRKEGVETFMQYGSSAFKDYSGNHHAFFSAKESFETLWQSINGNWDDNPWVWKVEFEVINENILEVMQND